MSKIKTHSFVFNPGDNGGESLMLTTVFVPNGDPGVVCPEQTLTLQSYCNSASFNLVGAPMTPDILRQLANELEKAEIQAISELPKEN